MAHKQELPPGLDWAWSWQALAACAQDDDALFFHPDGERGVPFLAREQAAKEVCARCPVLSHCREYALAHREPYGVWGGLGETERRQLLLAARRRNERSVRGPGTMRSTTAPGSGRRRDRRR